MQEFWGVGGLARVGIKGDLQENSPIKLSVSRIHTLLGFAVTLVVVVSVSFIINVVVNSCHTVPLFSTKFFFFF